MLDLRKTLTLLVLLPACCLPAYSQQSDSFWKKIVNMISAPSMELDPGAVTKDSTKSTPPATSADGPPASNCVKF